ncbi:FAD-binding domain-containing protein [Pseudomarimonas salicorniae]|uniref:DNA photolyase family protein n=1 Tax=Pseudomarimonas salicorniae TaxID=2933270 RepID=A0ABT0GLR2_9GAMM|nr:deoxyribodipyrimidine photo-lyase [Lysobacter sp. CAU 1642]MCK7595479.1 DNA photolyase family protein [Lysobacter sp. CAU 1642]
MVVIVWFKRDLRIADHAPLLAACGSGGEVVPLYIIEPEAWAQPDASPRHGSMLRPALEELDAALRRRGSCLVVRRGEAIEVLDALRREVAIAAVHSHEETGNGWSYARDRAVARWLREHGIEWREWPQGGVVRRLRSRDGWARQWEQRMSGDPLPAPGALRLPRALLPLRERSLDLGGLPLERNDLLQAGGRIAARDCLESFLDGRGAGYQRGMSSPLRGAEVCSRLSVGLATGAVSMREVVRRTRAARNAGEAMTPARDLVSFDKRLHWHCHFIQKLESQPDIEFRNVHRGFDGLRETGFDSEAFGRWCRGETGWPFVDACMRSLLATGWLNFRMRAMLVAVSSYHLWLHWREPALHLARQFSDYEPGIHYSQVQMQAGVTGINIPRIYNPVKQSLDQDPEGEFIRRWLPELAALPGSRIHEPWRMSSADQRRYGVRLDADYPLPVRDHLQAARQARDRLFAWRGREGMAEQSRSVLARHGSRRPAGRRVIAGDAAPSASRQADLFGG